MLVTDHALERFAQLRERQCVRRCALGKTDPGGFPRVKYFLRGHTHLAVFVRNKNETAARDFEEQIERDLPGRVRRPRALSCQAISFVLIDPAQKLA